MPLDAATDLGVLLIVISAAQFAYGLSNDTGYRQAVAPDAIQGRNELNHSHREPSHLLLRRAAGGTSRDALGYQLAIGIAAIIFAIAAVTGGMICGRGDLWATVPSIAQDGACRHFGGQPMDRLTATSSAQDPRKGATSDSIFPISYAQDGVSRLYVRGGPSEMSGPANTMAANRRQGKMGGKRVGVRRVKEPVWPHRCDET